MDLATLDSGLLRAEQLAKGETPWTTLEKRNVLRAYRSVIDGTAQPYGVTYPLEYGKDPKRKWRVDVVLHGRNGTLTEVAFPQLAQWHEENRRRIRIGCRSIFSDAAIMHIGGRVRRMFLKRCEHFSLANTKPGVANC